MAELPHIIPIFPLPNFVLFPDVIAPLHIFEPRYREMIADVSRTDGIVGITMLKGDWERDYYEKPDLYQVGCAGRIGALSRLPDGRYNLMLEGLAEFQILREIHDHSYRTAEVQWRAVPAPHLNLDPVAMEELRDLLMRFLGSPANQLWQSLVEEKGLRGAELINFICFHLDVYPIEKQTLLEAGVSRATCLNDVLTFHLEERKLGPGPAGGRSGPLQ
jgi:Lon protease-like protein